MGFYAGSEGAPRRWQTPKGALQPRGDDVPLQALTYGDDRGPFSSSAFGALATAGLMSREALTRSLSEADTCKLVAAIQALAGAHSLDDVMGSVHCWARELSGADGVTFVLRDQDSCYFADENAIAPLWKGRRFPARVCVSGWAMRNRRPVVIPDIYRDDRVPLDVYRSTFVKSLAMVPVRQEAPIAAIGAYWATAHVATTRELTLLQAFANACSVALANVELLLEARRERDKFAQLTEVLPEVVFAASAQGDARYFNGRWSELTGLTESESRGRGWQAAVHPED
ncbi:MAG TPA: GAF domain-containing protein, partial [Myxococcota bacterium]|nr:GAF domain-containing protein [Myxococcota bacterium]